MDNIENENDAPRNSSTPVSRAKPRRSTSSDSTASSSSTSSSSSSSSDEAMQKRKRSHRRRNKKRGSKRSRHRLDKICKQVSDLRKQIACNIDHNPNNYFEDLTIDHNVSRELYEVHNLSSAECNPEFVFDIETKLKEPAVPKAPEQYLSILQDIQHFEKSEWCEVRYTDTQKNYNLSPGFVELDANDEIKQYDSLRHLAYADKSYAALTSCVLKQKDALQNTLRSLLMWARDTDQLNFDGLTEKVNELFQKGDFHKVSSDLLQLICGHRAETIQMRRDGITKFVRDPLVKSTLRKIPPSCQHLFKADLLTAALEKTGGVRKAFMPLTKPANNASASQAGPSKANSHPSQGSTSRNAPSQGGNCGNHAHPNNCNQQYPHAPSQGCCHYRPSQGPKLYSNQQSGGNQKSSFRFRNGRQGQKGNDQNKGNRKRGGSPTPASGNKRRRY